MGISEAHSLPQRFYGGEEVRQHTVKWALVVPEQQGPHARGRAHPGARKAVPERMLTLVPEALHLRAM